MGWLAPILRKVFPSPTPKDEPMRTAPTSKPRPEEIQALDRAVAQNQVAAVAERKSYELRLQATMDDLFQRMGKAR